MNIWVMTGVFEGEQFATTHFTEKGAMLSGIADMMDFLGIEDQESALSVFNDRLDRLIGGEEESIEGVLETDFDKMRSMPMATIQRLFRDYAEMAWDNDRGYMLEVVRTQVAA